MQLIPWVIERRAEPPSADSPTHAESEDSNHESEAPLSLRVSQAVSYAGMTAGACYATAKGMQNDRVGCAMGVTLVGYSAYLLWLVKRNVDLRKVGSFTKKVDRLGDRIDSDTKNVENLNQQIAETGRKIADETSGVVQSVHKAEQVATELLRRESDLMKREANLIALQQEVNQTSKEENVQLKKRLAEEKAAHERMREANEVLQQQIDELSKSLNEEKSGLALLRTVADKRKKELDELRELNCKLEIGTKALRLDRSSEPALGQDLKKLTDSVDAARALMERLGQQSIY